MFTFLDPCSTEVLYKVIYLAPFEKHGFDASSAARAEGVRPFQIRLAKHHWLALDLSNFEIKSDLNSDLNLLECLSFPQVRKIDLLRRSMEILPHLI